jgi:hypothetical protein
LLHRDENARAGRSNPAGGGDETSESSDRLRAVAVRHRLLLASAACALIGLTAPGSGAAAAELDKAKLDELRSLIAEAAALQAAEARNRVTAAYARGLRQDLREDLGKLVSDPTLGRAARGGLMALDHGDAAALARWRDALVRLERAHGRAG